MPFVSGFLHVRSDGHPDNELPEAGGPTDPGYGISSDRPDQGLPPPPPGIWPPPHLHTQSSQCPQVVPSRLQAPSGRHPVARLILIRVCPVVVHDLIRACLHNPVIHHTR